MFSFLLDWICEQAWDNITELDKVAGFHGVIDSFEQNYKAWQGEYIRMFPIVNIILGDIRYSLVFFHNT